MDLHLGLPIRDLQLGPQIRTSNYDAATTYHNRCTPSLVFTATNSPLSANAAATVVRQSKTLRQKCIDMLPHGCCRHRHQARGNPPACPVAGLALAFALVFPLAFALALVFALALAFALTFVALALALALAFALATLKTLGPPPALQPLPMLPLRPVTPPFRKRCSSSRLCLGNSSSRAPCPGSPTTGTSDR